jgi:hypothetical protein
MDPVTASLTAIASAIAAGAAASMKDTASAVVKDAYAGIKALIVRKYGSVDLAAVEKKPDSEAKRESLEEDLADAGAEGDDELARLARALVEAVERNAPEAAAAVGVDLEKVKAGFLRVGSVDAEGTGVKVRDAEFSGGIDIGSVRAGRQGGRGEKEDDSAAGPR